MNWDVDPNGPNPMLYRFRRFLAAAGPAPTDERERDELRRRVLFMLDCEDLALARAEQAEMAAHVTETLDWYPTMDEYPFQTRDADMDIVVYVGGTPGNNARARCRDCGWMGEVGSRHDAAGDFKDHRKVCKGWTPYGQNAIDFEIACMGQTVELPDG